MAGPGFGGQLSGATSSTRADGVRQTVHGGVTTVASLAWVGAVDVEVPAR